MPELNRQTMLYASALTMLDRAGWTLAIDGERPNWVSTDARGAWLLRTLGESPCSFAALVERYASHTLLDTGKAWTHVHAWITDALRHGIVARSPASPPPYLGRSRHLTLSRLRECWLHTNNSCNLACGHCLVSSSPRGEAGLPTATWRGLIAQAAALGVDRFYITGGEPFVRPDMPELIRCITGTHSVELILLTNATLFGGARQAMLEAFDRQRVRFQVSVDGSTSEINDAIRGEGSLRATVEGLRQLCQRGFDVTITTVVTDGNLDDLPNITRLAQACGVRAQHLMWMHRRGRATDRHGTPPALPALALMNGGPMIGSDASPPQADLGQAGGWFPSVEELIEAVQVVHEEAQRCGVTLDNAASFELRANAPAGTKFDLGNAGWQSVCIYADGHLYPSAALANHQPLDCGELTNGRRLEDVWRTHPVLERIRQASVVEKPQAADDPLRYLTGGGDVEHSYLFSGDFLGDDPYYPLYRALLLQAMDDLARRKVEMANAHSGYDAPRIYHAMGDGGVVCGTTELSDADIEVAFLHSNCVLSFDVEKPRRLVQQFYGQAAQQPQTQLCCPTAYDPADTGHIPQGVLDRFYGCGSPVASANPQPGETYVDLGSGAGIDCFIAARRVGPSGRVIGVDMTEPMLAVAREHQLAVARSLGYDVVEFRQGFLEQLPLEDRVADVVTSNCVINLSPDKPTVFAELWRILKDHGRAVIADIVSDREVPARLKINEQLWGECIVGALTEEQFLATLEQAGFYGLSVLKRTCWKTVEGFNFFSLTVQGWKLEQTQGCTYLGQTAIYRGPFKAVLDEAGHLFPRHVAVSVCTDTAGKLARPPYAGLFAIIEPDGATNELPSAASCCPSPTGAGCC